MQKKSHASSARISLRQKIFLSIFGVFLCLILLEIALRLSGLVYYLIYKLPQDRGANYRILCVGESSTFGIGTKNPTLQNYPHQLEKMLNEKFPDRKIQCFFDQGIGTNTSENLIKLPACFEKYRPDLVIFMVGANNWWNLNKSNILIFQKNKGLSYLFIKLAVFLNQFRVYKLFKWIAYGKGIYKVNDSIDWPDESTADVASTEKRLKIAWELGQMVKNKYHTEIFDEIAFYDLKEMIGMCKDYKIKVIISSYPVSEPGLYEVQKKASLLFNCPFVDNYLAFKNIAHREEYLYSDNWHPNEKGYRLLAENIYNCILGNKLIE